MLQSAQWPETGHSVLQAGLRVCSLRCNVLFWSLAVSIDPPADQHQTLSAAVGSSWKTEVQKTLLFKT